MSNIVYSAVFLTSESRADLMAKIRPALANIIAHHVTLKFKPTQTDIDMLEIGRVVEMTVIGVAASEDVQAVVVALPADLICSNAYPHVTVSTAPYIASKYANSLLISRGYTLIDPFVIHGTVGVFTS